MSVDRYEFPDEKLGPTEDNPDDDDFYIGRFLIVSHECENAGGQWRAAFPTMDTIEFSRFIDWLENVRSNQVKDDRVYFTERCLEFTIDQSSTSLLVHLSWDLLPSWIGQGETITLKFPITDIDLDAAIVSLRDQYAKFPGRPPLHNAG